MRISIAPSLVLFLSIACGGPADPESSTDLSAGRRPPSGGTITGTVYAMTPSGRSPLQGATVWFWLETTSGGGGSLGSVTTNASGQFTKSGVQNGSVFISSYHSVYSIDGCLTNLINFSGSAAVEIDRFSPNDPADWRIDTVLAGTPPVVSGVVYENNAEGRVPSAGADIWFDRSVDVWLHYSTTDANGRYAVCGANAGGLYYAIQDGYEWSWAYLEGPAIYDFDLYP